MSRVKRGVAAHKKHKKLLSQAEGRRASKHKLVRPAREAAMHALRYAYRDRRARKGQFRALWIARINAAAPISATARSASSFRSWPAISLLQATQSPPFVRDEGGPPRYHPCSLL